MFADEDAELDLAADLIAHGKTSRLYQSLVYERQIAADVIAYQHSREISGVFQIATTAAPGVTLGELHRAIIQALTELGAAGPTDDELERARAQTSAQFVYRLQTIGGFGGKSDQLNAYNVFRGDPGFFAADRARYAQASNTSIAAAVRRWIVDRPARRAERRPARRDRPGARRVRRGARLVSRVDRTTLPVPVSSAPFRFPAIHRRRLSNGLDVRVVTHRAVPIVSAVLLVRGGTAADPPQREGLAAFTADLLDEGSGGRSALRSPTSWRAWAPTSTSTSAPMRRCCRWDRCPATAGRA